MKSRMLFIFIVLMIVGSMNVIKTSYCQDGSQLRVVGKINNIYQNNTLCIIQINRYNFEINEKCNFSRGTKIGVIGSCNNRLIDKIQGKIFLSDAKIDENILPRPETGSSISEHSVFDTVREKITSIYYRFLPSSEAGLVAGIVLGDKTGISGDLYQEMISSGTIHIAVASGYNLMLVGGTTINIMFWFCKRQRATLLAILVMIGYALLAGGEPPVVRALIMSTMIFTGAAIGRTQTTWWALLLTIWLMMILDMSLISSASFQLSVAASIGLMIVEPVVVTYIDTLKSRLLLLFSRWGLVATVSTLLTTAPVIYLNFGRLSLVSLVSNTLILPMVPVLMVLGVLMLLVGQMLTVPVYVISHLMLIIIHCLGR